MCKLTKTLIFLLRLLISILTRSKLFFNYVSKSKTLLHYLARYTACRFYVVTTTIVANLGHVVCLVPNEQIIIRSRLRFYYCMSPYVWKRVRKNIFTWPWNFSRRNMMKKAISLYNRCKQWVHNIRLTRPRNCFEKSNKQKQHWRQLSIRR